MSRTLQTNKAALDANLSPLGTIEKEIYGLMTLFFHKLLQYEPTVVDDESEGGGAESSLLTKKEREEMNLFAKDRLSSSSHLASSTGRDSGGSTTSGKPSSPTARRSKVLGFGDIVDDDALPLSDAIALFDASNLGLGQGQGRKAAADGIAILVKLANETNAMRKESYRCKRRLYQIVQSFAVFANDNVNVRIEIADHIVAILGICFSWHDTDSQPSSPTSTTKGKQMPVKGGRSLAEIEALRSTLQARNVPVSVVHELCECYSLEMLLDAGLPPSVCSSRFEGLMTIMWERRGRVVSTITQSRAVLTLLLKAINLTQLEYVLMLGMCVEPKGRAKFYDRLISEGGLGMLLHAAKDASQISTVLSSLLLLTVPCMEGGKVVADSATAGGGSGNKQAPKEEATKSKVVQCTAWATDPQLIYDLLLSLGNTMKRARISDSTLEPRMAELLENIVCFSRHMAAVAAGAIASMMEEVMCPFIPIFFPAIIMYLKRKEAAEMEETVHDWLNTIGVRAANIVSAKRAGPNPVMDKPTPIKLISSATAAATQRNRSASPTRKRAEEVVEATPANKMRGATSRGKAAARQPPVLLGGAVIAAAAPYLGFVRALVEDTAWRAGIHTLLVRIKVVCDALLNQRRGGRPTLGTGSANHVLKLIAPLLASSSPTRANNATAAKRARSVSKLADGSPSARTPGKSPDRQFFSVSGTPKSEGSVSPVAVVVPYNTKNTLRLFNCTSWAERSLDDDEDD